MKKILLLSIITSLLIPATAFAAFSDVNSDHVYHDAINYTKSAGIVNGYSDGTYKPDDQINRAEFTKIIITSLYDEAEIKGNDCFEDIKTEWFAKYICTAKTKNIVSGYPTGYFYPSENISFVEAAKILMTAFEQVEANLNNPWYKPYVETLQEKKAIPPSIQDFSQNITRGEMAEMIYRLNNDIQDKESRTFSFAGKVYINDKYGFSFEYPDNMFAYDTYDLISFQNGLPDIAGFSYTKPGQYEPWYAAPEHQQGLAEILVYLNVTEDLESWVQSHVPYNNQDWTKTKIDTVDALVNYTNYSNPSEGAPRTFKTYYLKNNDKIFEIYGFSINNPYTNKWITDFDAIVSTFTLKNVSCEKDGCYAAELKFISGLTTETRIFKKENGNYLLVGTTEKPIKLLSYLGDQLFFTYFKPDTDAPNTNLLQYTPGKTQEVILKELKIGENFRGWYITNYRVSPNGKYILYATNSLSENGEGSHISILDLINDKETLIEDFPAESEFSLHNGNEDAFGGFKGRFYWEDNSRIIYAIYRKSDAPLSKDPYMKKVFTTNSYDLSQ